MVLSAEKVKLLREYSGAGMMDCKAALLKAEGDMDLARGFLRIKGVAVKIHGDREKWEREQAEKFAELLRRERNDAR